MCHRWGGIEHLAALLTYGAVARGVCSWVSPRREAGGVQEGAAMAATQKAQTHAKSRRAGFVSLPAAGRAGKPPKLRTQRKVSPAVVAMWKAWWASPMATQWDEGTAVWPLTRLALMYDDLFRDELESRGTTEMRQIENEFGLTDKGRRTLGWQIVDEPADEKAGRPASVTSMEGYRSASAS